MSYEDVAREMGLMLATIQGHARRLYKMRKVHSKAQLIAAAKRREAFAKRRSITRAAG